MSIAFHCSKRLLIAGKKRDFAASEVSGVIHNGGANSRIFARIGGRVVISPAGKFLTGKPRCLYKTSAFNFLF